MLSAPTAICNIAGKKNKEKSFFLKNKNMSKTSKKKHSKVVNDVIAAGRTPLADSKFGVVKQGGRVANFAHRYYFMSYREWITTPSMLLHFTTLNELNERILSVMPDFDFTGDYVIVQN
jgi:hypothetical protein